MARRDNPRDGFFSKVLVATIVVIWVALVGGNWIGHLAIQSGVLGKTEDVKFKVNEPRPKPWVTVDPRIQRELERNTGITPSAAVSSPTPATPAETPQVSLTSRPLEPTGEPTPLDPPVVETPTPQEVHTPAPPVPPVRTPDAPAATPVDEQAPTATPAAPGSGEFQLQFGSFGSMDNARRLADELKSKGQEARVEEIQTATGPVFRVRGGTYSENAAHEQMEKLKSQNVDAYIVNP